MRCQGRVPNPPGPEAADVKRRLPPGGAGLGWVIHPDPIHPNDLDAMQLWVEVAKARAERLASPHSEWNVDAATLRRVLWLSEPGEDA